MLRFFRSRKPMTLATARQRRDDVDELLAEMHELKRLQS